jgi:hypothetical protein
MNIKAFTLAAFAFVAWAIPSLAGTQGAIVKIGTLQDMADLGAASSLTLSAEVAGVRYDWYSASLSASYAPYNVACPGTAAAPGVTAGDPYIAATGVATTSCWVRKALKLAIRVVTYSIGNKTIQSSDGIVRCDSTAGNVTFTAPPALGSSAAVLRVRIEKISADTNYCIITSDGTTVVAYVINQNDAGGAGFLDIEMDGTIDRVLGVP